MNPVDPFDILGVSPAASERELAAAYRDLAKEWHPDRRGEAGARRMAEINAAYELLRAGAHHERFAAAMMARTPPPGEARAAAARRLPHAIRRALGPELAEAVASDEKVRLVTPVSTWTSPRAILALTDRRLLWLLDDAPVGRVRTLNLRDVAAIEARYRRPRRRVATLHLRTTGGRRYSFAQLRPATAAAIERQVRG